MTKLEEAARMALEALEYRKTGDPDPEIPERQAAEALRAALAEPAAKREGLTEEHLEALCEAFENEAEEAHFKARPQIDFIAYRTPFRAGFVAGWKAARAIESEVRK